MTDLDLERLGDVWRQQPDPEELKRLQRSAQGVRRRAQLQQILDVVTATLVAGVVLYFVSTSGRIDAVLVGTAAILVLLLNSVRQRRLREVELRSLAGSTEDMLDQSIERVETTQRHNRWSLIGIGPACALAMFFAATADGGNLRGVLGTPELRVMLFGAGIALMVGLFVFLVLALRRGRRELDRLRSLRNAYRTDSE